MTAKRPLRIGLTGGVASGKSTVADMFAEHGVPIIDTDLIARDVVQPGQPGLEEIERVFGAEVIDRDGALRRRRLRELVFADEGKRKMLEAILHPRIRDAALEKAEAAGGPYQIIVVPLLVGSPMQKMMDRILVVDVSEAVQLERLRQRDEETEEQARRMIAAQSGRADRLGIADDVVANDGSLEETADQVSSLHRQYLELAATI